MRAIPVREAVGTVLGHDITEIAPGRFKGRAFKKGHVVREEDVPKLLDLGKEHLFVFEMDPGSVHEDEAATRIARALAGQGLRFAEPVEGKVKVTASVRGLLKVNVEALDAINGIDQICVATLHTHQIVEPESLVAGCRVVPLVIDGASIERVEALAQRAFPVLEVRPLRHLRIGIVTTGSEVFHGRIEDRFGPVLTAKIAALGSEVMRQILVPDDRELIVSAIETLLGEGAEMILVTGGMSVDPDDLTPSAIRVAGGVVEVFGAPALPGSMLMLAHIGAVPVLGLPGCVMYRKATLADVLLPRILAGDEVTRSDVARMGHGGLCLECDLCRYPTCPFGKGT